jgi:hypothetical protein
VRGEVTAITSDSITVKIDDGHGTDPAEHSTTYHQATSSSVVRVAVGDKVAVQAGAPTSPTVARLSPAASPAPAASAVPTRSGHRRDRHPELTGTGGKPPESGR